MSGRSFLDSNLLVCTDDASAPGKRDVADLQAGRRIDGLEIVNPFS